MVQETEKERGYALSMWGVRGFHYRERECAEKCEQRYQKEIV